MVGVKVLLVVTLLLLILGVGEYALHRRRLHSIPIRIHVNGTRGKSSVTRLIAAGLREGGRVTFAKTTGTLARAILPDGRELPIFRPAGPNIIEQKRIVALAAAHRAEALVIECMAVEPLLQSLSELRLVKATHGVITNARPDHLEVMGPTAADVTRALAGTVPVHGKLYTAERAELGLLQTAAADRDSELIVLSEQAVAECRDAAEGFSYTEHPDNIALALRICEDLGVDRPTALRGMQHAAPDPGAQREYELDYFGRRMLFVNGFAANDPISSRQVWEGATERHPSFKQRIAVFNCRQDRPDRSLQLGRVFPRWSAADRVVLMGTGTHVFADAAVRAGLDETLLVSAENLSADAVFETILGLITSTSLVIGLGNTAGQGLDLAQYFRNRAIPKEG